MMSRWSAIILVCLAVGAGCGGPPGSGDDAAPTDGGTPDAAPPDATPLAPPLYNEVDLPDGQLAFQALELLGSEDVGAAENCGQCHGLIRQTLYYWRAISDQSLATCLTDLTAATRESASGMIDCLRAKPTDGASSFQAPKSGIFSAAAHLDWFQFTFERAYPDTWEVELQDYVDRVAMPRGTHAPYTSAEWDIVATWIMKGLPELETYVPADPIATECLPGVSADVGAHVARMATEGWRAVNAERGILMFGCGGASEPLECLTSFPRAGDDTFSEGWEAVTNTTIRVLFTIDYPSSFWTRASADGRFVAHGAEGGGLTSAIIDLLEQRIIPTEAFFDPSWFPDNSGFVFQGNDAFLCNMDVLSGSPTEITYTEAGCSSTSAIGLYQHVGAALDGGDYWAIDGQFVSDNGGHEATFGDVAAWFSGGSDMDLTPMIHDGTRYIPLARIEVEIPYEGDTVMSPSSELLVSRVRGPSATQLGLVLRKMTATPVGASYTVEAPEIARYCFSGGKPDFSYDERWMVIHHYISNTDADAQDLGFVDRDAAGFAPYRSMGTANVYLLDLLTGETTRITMMQPGQYALFPHFRSDGWIYFQVRTADTETEYVAASDAALVIEAAE